MVGVGFAARQATVSLLPPQMQAVEPASTEEMYALAWL